MKKLLLIVPLFVLALSGTTLAAQDPDIQYLIERMQALEETVNTQAGQIESQRAEIEGLKAVQRRSSGTPTYRGVAYRLPEPEGSGHDISGEDLENAIKDYLGTEQGKELIAESSPSKLRAGYRVGKGFYLETLDEKFKLNILGRLQVRYNYRDNEDGRDTSSFRINRVRLKFSGHAFTKNLNYLLQWELNSFMGRGQLKDVFVDYRFFPELRLRAGQWKVPYNRQNMASDYKKQFIDESITNDAFSLGRDIGVMLHGELFRERLEYYAGIFTGRGVNATQNTNNKNMVVARLDYRPFGKFKDYWESDVEDTESFKAAVGTAFAINNGTQIFFNNMLRTFPKDAQYVQFVVDGIMKYRGFSLEGAYEWRNLDRRGFNHRTANGFFVQGGFFPMPKRLELAARYAQVDPNVNDSDNLEREFTLGTNWYFSRNHHNKLQANISRFINDKPTGGHKEDMLISLMYQIEW
ncbi:MAG: porin [Candidatus Bathyanammoxibius sp.]